MGYAAAACCAILAVFDARSGKIPNRLLVLFGMAGLAGSFAVGGMWRLFEALAGAAAMFFLLWLLWRLRLMGAGDVKLFMMLGTYCGWPGVLFTFAGAVAAGSVFAAAHFLRRGDAKERFKALLSYLEELGRGGRPKAYFAEAERGARVSFAVFAAIGTLGCALAGII